MALADFFATMRPFLEGRVGASETAAALGGVPAARLGIYGDFSANHRRDTLAGIYIHCRRALGERWPAVVEAFFRACPAMDWELNANAEPFVGWAQARAAAGDLPPWMGDLADLEWWEWAVWVAPSRRPPAPRGAALALAAGVALRPYRWDVVSWMDAAKAEAAPGPAEPAPRDHLVLFWRRPGSLHMARGVASPIELVALKAAFEGVSLARAARAAGVAPRVLEETVSDLVEAGALVRLRRRRRKR
jgi:hypothetical protein